MFYNVIHFTTSILHNCIHFSRQYKYVNLDSGLPDNTKILGQTVISVVKKTKKTKGKYKGK